MISQKSPSLTITYTILPCEIWFSFNLSHLNILLKESFSDNFLIALLLSFQQLQICHNLSHTFYSSSMELVPFRSFVCIDVCFHYFWICSVMCGSPCFNSISLQVGTISSLAELDCLIGVNGCWYNVIMIIIACNLIAGLKGCWHIVTKTILITALSGCWNIVLLVIRTCRLITVLYECWDIVLLVIGMFMLIKVLNSCCNIVSCSTEMTN